jgi:hypothetical protein
LKRRNNGGCLYSGVRVLGRDADCGVCGGEDLGGGVEMNTCKHCLHFHVPDDGKEWGPSGVCHRLEYAEEPVLVFDVAASDLAEDLWSLPCGCPVVKEYYSCDLFEDKVALGEAIDLCMNLYALEIGK